MATATFTHSGMKRVASSSDLLIGRKLAGLVLAQLVLLVLQDEAHGFRGEVHVVAGVGDKLARHLGDRAVGVDLRGDLRTSTARDG